MKPNKERFASGDAFKRDPPDAPPSGPSEAPPAGTSKPAGGGARFASLRSPEFRRLIAWITPTLSLAPANSSTKTGPLITRREQQATGGQSSK